MAARQKISEDAGTAAALSEQDGIFPLKKKQKKGVEALLVVLIFFFSPNWLWQELKHSGYIAASHEVAMCSLCRLWHQHSTGSSAFDSHICMWRTDGFPALH